MTPPTTSINTAKPLKLLLTGPQGSGKGTVGRIVSERLKIPLIGAGALLRALPKTDPRYVQVHKDMDAGGLVSHELVADLLKTHLASDVCRNGYILDGYPRDMEQIGLFDPPLGYVIVLDISMDTIVKRVTGRRMCDSDGKIYNIYTLPKEELAGCTGNLTQRKDDTVEALEERLAIYFSQTSKVLEHYRSMGILKKVDAEGTPDEVAKNVLDALGIV